MMTFLNLPTELYLEICPESALNFWQKSRSYGTNLSQWRAYLNQVTLSTFLEYLESEQNLSVKIWPSLKASSHLWEILNGSVISFAQKRLLLLPTEAVDGDEFCIPQEWVDLPSFAADYYLLAQINPDERNICISGYITHRILKQKASYDHGDRCYYINREDLIPDLAVLWATYELYPEENTKECLPTLEPISINQAENLIQRLGDCTIIDPRLEVPLSLWGAILEKPHWRDQLLNNRLGITVNKPVNIVQWFKQTFDQGWESLELAGVRNRTASTDKNTLKRAKYIEISPELAVILELEITSPHSLENNVTFKLHPKNGDRYLPEGIKFKVLSSEENLLLALKAPQGTNLIKKQFTLLRGDRVTVEISLNGFKFSQEFLG